MNPNLPFQCGDIILYWGRHPLHLRQQEATGCPWAQVGMILADPDVGPPCVFESTKLSPCRDVRTGAVVKGVQIARLDERLAAFDGRVSVRRVRPGLSEARRQLLHAFVDEVHGRPFNDSKWVAARAFFRRNDPPDGSSYFCSELIAEALQRLGLLPRPPLAPSCNNYIPADFTSAYPEACLPLRGGYTLEPEYMLPDPRGRKESV